MNNYLRAEENKCAPQPLTLIFLELNKEWCPESRGLGSTVSRLFSVWHWLLFFFISPTSFQTLCILANIADGTTAKELIMTNDDILQKIKYYMVSIYIDIPVTFFKHSTLGRCCSSVLKLVFYVWNSGSVSGFLTGNLPKLAFSVCQPCRV